ncbi:hypothetical protein D9X91_14040 [Falsibacillus albus]|uniref:Uncharacterized protein n=1 Tax=Falsibacillus albus TaxID=2478915 RepID=A0A3L7JWZ1_9BACI|nr:hypothetical protein D9X91_14040 [Falsibacillus albus]
MRFEKAGEEFLASFFLSIIRFLCSGRLRIASSRARNNGAREGQKGTRSRFLCPNRSGGGPKGNEEQVLVPETERWRDKRERGASSRSQNGAKENQTGTKNLFSFHKKWKQDAPKGIVLFEMV